MERLLTNATPARRERLHGRDYLVAPATLIVPGVLAGSQGALLYPPDEVARDPQAWNGVPLLHYHPTRNGVSVSGRDPEILGSQQLGVVYRARARPGGPLRAEAWFDVELTRQVNPSLLGRLLGGRPVELSTGLWTENVPAPAGSHYRGRPYTHVARNYRPDHLAVLPDQVGACSLQDGCGILVNSKRWLPLIVHAESGGCKLKSLSNQTVARLPLAANHLPGKHDQKSHGRRGVDTSVPYGEEGWISLAVHSFCPTGPGGGD